jgi:predicted CxxxxCH...CXXCH cytochrome family protein
MHLPARPSGPKLLHLHVWLLALALALAACGDDGGEAAKESPDATEDVSMPREKAPAGCEMPDIEIPESCGACHGAPPTTPRHPPNPMCWRCHGYVVDDKLDFVDQGLHDNGEIDVAVGCSSCHGWKHGVSPPQGLDGACEHGAPRVGAHAPHRRSSTPAHNTGCSNCHVVPVATWADGHVDGDDKAELTFAHLATAGGAQPKWDGETCSSVYCHGSTLSGGDHKAPSWFDNSGAAGRCGACHRLTDPQGNEDADCHSCHPTSVDAQQRILPFGDHVNGTIDMGGSK